MAGESAQERYEKIRGGRRDRLRDNLPLLLGLTVLSVAVTSFAMHLLIGTWWIGAIGGLLPVSNLLLPSQREVAWRKGAEGERAVARVLDGLSPARALHDRRIPGSRANIDHILVAPTGVWTVDAKNYTGKLTTRSGGQELWVKGRDRSKLLDQARRQARAVTEALTAAGITGVPVRPALCFLGVEWPLLFRPRRAGDVELLSPRRLGTLTKGDTALTAAQFTRVCKVLDDALRPAADTPATETTRVAMRKTVDATPPPSSNDPSPSSVTVTPWKRYGKDRLYVNAADGTTLGYVDLQNNDVVPTDERHRDVVRDAVTAHLRSN